MHSVRVPMWQTQSVWPERTAHVSVLRTVIIVLHNPAQSFLIIFPLNLQTITIIRMLSSGGEGKNRQLDISVFTYWHADWNSHIVRLSTASYQTWRNNELRGTIGLRAKQPLPIVQVTFQINFLSIDFVVFQFFVARVCHAIENSFHVESVDGVRWQCTLVHLTTFNHTQQSKHTQHNYDDC